MDQHRDGEHHRRRGEKPVFDAEPDVVGGVRACFDGAAAVLRATDYADACPIGTVALEVASSDDQLRRVTAEVFERWANSAAERLVAAGIAEKRSLELAVTLVGGLEGGFMLSRAAKDATHMETIGRAVAALVDAELASGRV